MKHPFTKYLLKWHRTVNTRSMPWKNVKDPYKVWLSEIILQQTRVEQGLPYYERFVKAFPAISDLANASEREVLKLWQGLGYYSRASNLHRTAIFVSQKLQGKFPENFEDLKKLKGIGDYTAAAIASFAFNKPKAVVDGNVVRILSRVFSIDMPFSDSKAKKLFQQTADALIDRKKPAEYNQAIMDFGSQVCKPGKPDCKSCPLNEVCLSFHENRVALFPVKKQKQKIKDRYFYYLVIEQSKKLLIQKRTGADIWKNLFELPLIETRQQETRFDSLIADFLESDDFTIDSVSEEQTQMLSHRKIHFRFIHLNLPENKNYQREAWQWMSAEELSLLPFPKTIHLYLHENSLL